MSNSRSNQTVTLVRVYTSDDHGHIHKVVESLHNRGDVIGTTLFRGIAGFGDEGHIHQSHLLDLSTSLPLIIEFYHKSEKSEELIHFMHEQIENAHIISWKVNLSYECLV